MTITKGKYLDMPSLKASYRNGENITELLRNEKNVNFNTSDIIEAAYDIQAGTYIGMTEKNMGLSLLYAREISLLLSEHLNNSDSLLDVGTGELTTLSLIANSLEVKPKSIYAFDISWSRLYEGSRYAQVKMETDFNKLNFFVGDIFEIPLLDKSIDVTTSSHALEPNGGRLEELINELFRVTKKKIILFEPCYEINTVEGKNRMDELGYIKNIEHVVKSLHGTLIKKTKIKNIANVLNPTVCFVIEPPKSNCPLESNVKEPDCIFSVPGTNLPLKTIDGFYFSNDLGLCYPVIKGIPIFKSKAAILASALCQ